MTILLNRTLPSVIAIVIVVVVAAGAAVLVLWNSKELAQSLQSAGGAVDEQAVPADDGEMFRRDMQSNGLR